MLIGQLDQPQPGPGDFPVEGVQGRLQVRQPDRGQAFRFGQQVLARRGQPPGSGLQGRQVDGDREVGVFEPSRQVGHADVGRTQPGPDRLGPVRGVSRVGNGGLFLFSRHTLAGELAQLRMIERTADGTRGAVDQSGRELGAHSVDTGHPEPCRLVNQLGVL